MALVDPDCFEGLSTQEQLQQIFEAAREIAINGGGGGGPFQPLSTVLTELSGGDGSSLTIVPGGALTGAFTASGMTMSTDRLLGRDTAGSGAVEEISLGTGFAFSAGSLVTTFTQTGTGAVATTIDARERQGWVLATDFGAVGDGATDDTTAIQNALNTGKHVLLPATNGSATRTYNITSPLVMDKVGQILAGEGMNRVRLLQVTSGQNAINIRQSSDPVTPQYPAGGYVQFPMVRDMKIEAQNAGTGVAVDIQSSAPVGGAGGDFARVERCFIYQFAKGILFTGVGQSLVFDCLIAYNTTGIEYAGSFQNSHQCYATRVVRGSTGVKVTGSGGVFMLGDLGQNSTYEVDCATSATFIGGNIEAYGQGVIGAGRAFRFTGGTSSVRGVRILASINETNEPFLVDGNASVMIDQCVLTQAASGTEMVKCTSLTARAWIHNLSTASDHSASAPEPYQINRSDIPVSFRPVTFISVMDNEVPTASAGLRGTAFQVINRTTGLDYLVYSAQTGSGTYAMKRLDAESLLSAANSWTAVQTANGSSGQFAVGPASGSTGGTFHYTGSASANSRDWDLRWDRYAFGDFQVRIAADDTSTSPTIPIFRIDGINNRTHVGHAADTASSGTKTLNIEGTLQRYAGTSTTFIQVPGVMNVNTTATGNVGTGEDNLIAYAVPANTLATNGDFIEFRAGGTIANNADAKRIKVKFGATTIFDTGAAGIPVSAAIDWQISGIVIRTGAATQKAIVSMSTNNAAFMAFSDYATAAETLSGSVTLQFTGEATSNNDIVQEMLTVEYKPGS